MERERKPKLINRTVCWSVCASISCRLGRHVCVCPCRYLDKSCSSVSHFNYVIIFFFFFVRWLVWICLLMSVSLFVTINRVDNNTIDVFDRLLFFPLYPLHRLTHSLSPPYYAFEFCQTGTGSRLDSLSVIVTCWWDSVYYCNESIRIRKSKME